MPEPTTLTGLLTRAAAERPDADALVLPQARLSYAALAASSRDVAASLAALGVRPGDRIGLFMPNGGAFISVLFGVLGAGAIAVPVNARLTARELRHVVADAGLRVLFADDGIGEPRSRLAVVAEALGPFGPGGTLGATGLPRVVSAAGPDLEAIVSLTAARPAGPVLSAAGFGALAAGADPAPAGGPRPGDPAMMFYTSGTTAMPKGCVLTHRALLRTGAATRHRLGYRDGERVFAPCPMFHTGSTQPMIATMHACGAMISMAHFEPGPALKLIEAERVTAMFPAFPALTEGMLASPDYSPDSFALVRTVFTVGPAEALRSMQRRMPHSTMVTAYGMTEFGGSVVMVSPADPEDLRLGTQGPPFPGIEIGIRDGDGRPLPAGQRGEIVVRGPSRFEHYHNDPGKTAQAIDAEGWYHSGDLGEIGADGRLRYLGRLKDMLKVGGENVAALEIAAHLQGHPAVRVAHVVGVADQKYGEIPAAFVEVRPGQALTEAEVIAHCRDGLASFKVPRHVRFVTEWPMSSTKVQTFRLREQLERELGLRRDRSGPQASD